MAARYKGIMTGAALLGILGSGGLTSRAAVHAAQARGRVGPPGTASALALGVDKPIIHLGESVLLSGRHYTPGATVTVSLHGPFAATLGRPDARVTVGADGSFAVRVRVGDYPDAQARRWHTVDMVAASSVRLSNGAQEGAMVPVQADPEPEIGILTHSALRWIILAIDGVQVRARVGAQDATHYQVSYAGHLRAGTHSAYLKWADASGATGSRAWTFRIGSPAAVPVSPRLSASPARVRLGESVVVSGQGWTPGATVTVRLGGPNTPPSSVAGRAIADAGGRFMLRLRITSYPNANARRGGMVEVSAQATGAAVGDLPEGTAMPLAVTS